MPDPLRLPQGLGEGDDLIAKGMGAYAGAIATGFHGYGARRIETLTSP